MATEAPTIGWIGTGRMGFQLAARLLEAGYDVAAWNRTRAKAEPLADKGATIVDRPADLAGRDIVFIMVSADPDLAAVVSGEGGLLTGDLAPKVIVDSSTVSPQASAAIRATCAGHGADFLAAPVSGNPKVIAAGKMTVAASGPRGAFDVAEPLLAVLGRGVTYVGDGEQARLVKIAHNVFLGVVYQSLAEITVLAEKGGISRSDFLAFFNDSVMGSTFSRYKTPALVTLDYTPTFTPILLRKDFDLGLEAAEQLGVSVPLVARARELVQALIDEGYTDVDFAALIAQQAKASGLELESEAAPVSDGLGRAA